MNGQMVRAFAVFRISSTWQPQDVRSLSWETDPCSWN